MVLRRVALGKARHRRPLMEAAGCASHFLAGRYCRRSCATCSRSHDRAAACGRKRRLVQNGKADQPKRPTPRRGLACSLTRAAFLVGEARLEGDSRAAVFFAAAAGHLSFSSCSRAQGRPLPVVRRRNAGRGPAPKCWSMGFHQAAAGGGPMPHALFALRGVEGRAEISPLVEAGAETPVVVQDAKVLVVRGRRNARPWFGPGGEGSLQVLVVVQGCENPDRWGSKGRAEVSLWRPFQVFTRGDGRTQRRQASTS